MQPAWRAFEQLVARIERALLPQGAIVQSPDKIVDKNTGQPREVDASIRYQLGSAPILITIECRDRISTQDVTWIEQLASKRLSVGADLTIAVSSTRFTGPAVMAAERLGIQLRLIEDITDQEIAKWAHDFVVRVRLLDWKIIRIAHHLHDRLQDVKIGSPLAELFQSHTSSSELILFYECRTNRSVSAKMLLDSTLQRNAVAVNQPKRRFTIRLEAPPDTYWVPTNHGERTLHSLEVEIDARFVVGAFDLTSVYEYSTANAPVAHIAEGSFQIDDNETLILSVVNAGNTSHGTVR
jgi:hypothetical protein